MRSVLLDTSFFIRFSNEDDPLFENADRYYQYFLQKGIALKCSTISVAEYCVKGDIDQLPLKNLQIVPFNLSHAQKAGELAKIVFDNKGLLELPSRAIIPNDTKLFSQADEEEMIDAYVTSDAESIKIYNLLNKYTKLRFQIIDLHDNCSDICAITPNLFTP